MKNPHLNTAASELLDDALCYLAEIPTTLETPGVDNDIALDNILMLIRRYVEDKGTQRPAPKFDILKQHKDFAMRHEQAQTMMAQFAGLGCKKERMNVRDYLSSLKAGRMSYPAFDAKMVEYNTRLEQVRKERA